MLPVTGRGEGGALTHLILRTTSLPRPASPLQTTVSPRPAGASVSRGCRELPCPGATPDPLCTDSDSEAEYESATETELSIPGAAASPPPASAANTGRS